MGTDGQLQRSEQPIIALQLPHEHSGIAQCVTISIGVAGVQPGMDTDPERLIAAADQALYQAKKLGRNRVVTLQAGAA